MNNDQITNLLTIILFIMLGILTLLILVYLFLKIRIKNKEKKRNLAIESYEYSNKVEHAKEPIDYTKQSIYSFMKFDKIEDNMIITKKGKKFIMVVECQGINYDLMSGVEKASTEQGFLQFLNTLRYPIQIYVQTRTVNLGNSIIAYKDKLKQVESRLISKQLEYNNRLNSGQYTAKELQKQRLEVVRDKNLYEYGKDIINNTEKMSLNKNILRKHYYIILSTIPEEINNPNFSLDELRDIAFNELYTKCQSAIGSLSVCGVQGRILNSNELAELLYVAYNRDDSEIYGMERALNARYDELYSTSQDVLDRKMKALDKKVEEDAERKANEVLLEIAEENRKEREVREKEENLDNLIANMAKMIIDENASFVGEEIAEKAKEKIDKEYKKEEEKNGKKEKTSRRRKASA